MKSPILKLALPLLIIALAMLVKLWTDGHALPMKDFVEYYSAGKAFLDHRNPYDPRLLLDMQREILRDPKVEQPIMMWNPPLAFVLVAPLGLLSPSLAHILWLLVQLAAVMGSVAMLMHVYCWPKERWIFGFVAALVMAPFTLVLWYGQIGGLLLLGLAGHLYCVQRGRYLSAGAFAALTALKPHLLFLFGLALILDAIVSARGRRVLLGGVIAISSAAFVAWLVNPMVYAYYVQSITAQSSDVHYSVRDWLQPNLSYWLRTAINAEQFRWQFLPTALISLLFLGWWLKNRARIDWPCQLPGLVFLSVIFTAYGSWLFDLVVLLVPVLSVLGTVIDQRRWWWVVAYGVLNLGTSLFPVLMVAVAGETVGLQAFIYYAPATFLLCALAGQHSGKKDA